MKVSLTIPFHNEVENLPILLPEIAYVLNSLRNIEFEVLLIDDCSVDGSAAYAAEFCKSDSRFHFYALPKRGGQTGAFQLAFALAKGDYIIRMDADLQDDPKDLPKLLDRLEEGYDLVMGIRTNRKHSLLMRFLTGSYDLVTGALFRTKLHSNSGSFIAFRANSLKNIPFKKNDHRYLPLIAIRRGASKRISIPVTHRERTFGQSKYWISSKVLFGFWEILRFYSRYISGHYDRKI